VKVYIICIYIYIYIYIYEDVKVYYIQHVRAVRE